MLAKVPRIITSWWPRRAPYELNSTGGTPCSWSHLPAGEEGEIEPAFRDAATAPLRQQAVQDILRTALLSGGIGEHGMAVMSKREGLQFNLPVTSDCAPLNRLVADMLAASRRIHSLRDPTRGGLASTLNEFARQSGVGISIEEAKIPVHDGVRGACELLGLDPLYIANEGKLVAVVDPGDAEIVLAAMRKNKYGVQAAIIGEVTAEHKGRVVMKTGIGSSRIVDMPAGEILPRIC